MKKKKHPKLIVFTAIKDIEIDFKRIDWFRNDWIGVSRWNHHRWRKENDKKGFNRTVKSRWWDPMKDMIDLILWKKKMEILTLTQDCLDSTLSLFFLNKQTLTERECERVVVKANEISRGWDCGGSLGWRAGDKHGYLKSDDWVTRVEGGSGLWVEVG
jgi:hypothetical protein